MNQAFAVRFICIVLCALAGRSQEQAVQEPETVVYGKYYHKSKHGIKDRSSNSFWLYKPPKADPGKLPVVFQFYGNAWSLPIPKLGLAPKMHPDPSIGPYLSKGIAFVSTGYRAVNAQFWYDDASGMSKMEELIHVDPEGRFTLDSNGLTMADYKIRACWMELLVKPIYDGGTALEKLIADADKHGLDVHRIFFIASSAGTAEVNYLTWVYHKWNTERYTPVGMILMDAQFDLPTRCPLDRVLKVYIDHADAGANLLVKNILPQRRCREVISNNLCMYGKACNETWNDLTINRFCKSGFDTLTFGDLYQTQKWNRDDPEVGRGMEKLWYASLNMLDHQPRPFYLFAASGNAGTSHTAIYSKSYGEMAEKLHLNFTVLYREQPDLKKIVVPSFEARPSESIPGPEGSSLIYRSSIPWPSHLVGYHAGYVAHVFDLLPKEASPQRLYSVDTSTAQSLNITSGSCMMISAAVLVTIFVTGLVLHRSRKDVEPIFRCSASSDSESGNLRLVEVSSPID